MTDTSKKPKIGLFVGIAAAVLALGLLFVTYTSAVAFGVEQEEAIKATHRNNVQILGNYTTRVAEQAQIPEMARDDLREVMAGAFQGRYGENGSQAAVQLIVENYPGQVDPQLYRNLQTTIESGRIEFRDNQTKLLDQKRVYQTNLSYAVRGFWLKLAGFPKIDLDQYDVVTSTAAERSFQTGVDDGVTLRRPAPAAPTAQ